MIELSSRENPLIKKVRALSSSARDRKKAAQTVLDGDHLLRAALDVGLLPEAVLVSSQGLSHGQISDAVSQVDGRCPVYLLPDALLSQCSPVATTSGLLSVLTPPAPPAKPRQGDAMLLERVQDAGNLGTMMRTATAAGIRHILLTPGCAQAWSPKTLRAGMGAHFLCDIHEDVDAACWLSGYEGAVYATTLGDGAQSIHDAPLTSPGVWLFGAEGAGLSDALIGLATQRVIIPMPGAIESLNVAAAAAICLFEQVRQRQC